MLSVLKTNSKSTCHGRDYIDASTSGIFNNILKNPKLSFSSRQKSEYLQVSTYFQLTQHVRTGVIHTHLQKNEIVQPSASTLLSTVEFFQRPNIFETALTTPCGASHGVYTTLLTSKPLWHFGSFASVE